MSYQIINNKIHTPQGCEVNVAYHCNLSCRGCTHLSPIMDKYFAQPDKVFKDLSILGKFFQPKFIKMLGGEPLLHPNINQVIKAVRASGIGGKILVCTNGKLLAKATEEFWEQIDALEISVYPSTELSSNQKKEIRHKAALYNVDFQLTYMDNFRESYSELGSKNKELVERIYRTCKVAHIWRCHTVDNGYFYKCPQSLFIPQVIDSDRLREHQEGIKITDSPEFFNDLLAYLKSREPLSSCYHCLGTAGKLVEHQQKSRKTWRAHQEYTIEEMIDMEYLSLLEKEPDANESYTHDYHLVD